MRRKQYIERVSFPYNMYHQSHHLDNYRSKTDDPSRFAANLTIVFSLPPPHLFFSTSSPFWFTKVIILNNNDFRDGSLKCFNIITIKYCFKRLRHDFTHVQGKRNAKYEDNKPSNYVNKDPLVCQLFREEIYHTARHCLKHTKLKYAGLVN